MEVKLTFKAANKYINSYRDNDLFMFYHLIWDHKVFAKCSTIEFDLKAEDKSSVANVISEFLNHHENKSNWDFVKYVVIDKSFLEKV